MGLYACCLGGRSFERLLTVPKFTGTVFLKGYSKTPNWLVCRSKDYRLYQGRSISYDASVSGIRELGFRMEAVNPGEKTPSLPSLDEWGFSTYLGRSPGRYPEIHGHCNVPQTATEMASGNFSLHVEEGIYAFQIQEVESLGFNGVGAPMPTAGRII
jgi:hypothetical protein